MTGRKDAQLKQVVAQGDAHHRAIGTKAMRVREVCVSPIDEHLCIAHVAWRAAYLRKDRPDVAMAHGIG